jgi:hypothetical protein
MPRINKRVQDRWVKLLRHSFTVWDLAKPLRRLKDERAKKLGTELQSIAKRIGKLAHAIRDEGRDQ